MQVLTLTRMWICWNPGRRKLYILWRSPKGQKWTVAARKNQKKAYLWIAEMMMCHQSLSFPRLIMKSRILGIYLKSSLPKWQHCTKWDGTWTKVVKDGCALEELVESYVVRRLFTLILIRNGPWRNETI